MTANSCACSHYALAFITAHHGWICTDCSTHLSVADMLSIMLQTGIALEPGGSLPHSPVSFAEGYANAAHHLLIHGEAYVYDRAEQYRNQVTPEKSISEPDAWLPMEIAPKDGTRIHLGFAHMQNFDVIAHWSDNDWSIAGDGKYAERLHGRPAPSGWRPLPSPPNALKSVSPQEQYENCSESGPAGFICELPKGHIGMHRGSHIVPEKIVTSPVKSVASPFHPQTEAALEAILGHIGQCDELLVRRIWDEARRAALLKSEVSHD